MLKTKITLCVQPNIRQPEPAPGEIIRPHDPTDRIGVGQFLANPDAGEEWVWEVRIFNPTGPFHVHFVASDLLHLQLWNPHFQVSILTPSRLTHHCYEAFPIAGWKHLAASYDTIAKAVCSEFPLQLPDQKVIAKVCALHIAAPELESRTMRDAHPFH